mgnify:CR=1 FL=1
MPCLKNCLPKRFLSIGYNILKRETWLLFSYIEIRETDKPDILESCEKFGTKFDNKVNEDVFKFDKKYIQNYLKNLIKDGYREI